MTSEKTIPTNSVALVAHLDRFPEDLRDIRRLQRRFALTTAEVSRAIESWRDLPVQSERGGELAH